MAVHSGAPADPVCVTFERWLAARQAGAAVGATVTAARGRPGRNLLIDAGWGGEAHRLAVRMTRVADSVAGHSDTRCQFLTLQRLRTQLHRPLVPQVLWWENSDAPLGAPFFVMTRIDGQTPDEEVLPYTFGSWVTDASPASRERMQRATVAQLARVHAAAPSDFWFLDRRRPGETPLAAHVRHLLELHEQCRPVPLIEQGFDWLRQHWPGKEPAPVLCWGDARLGNVVYRDFAPVALLDWEQATLAPREVDLGSLIFVHRFLDDRARAAGLPGLPDLLRTTDVADAYFAASGYHPAHLDFYVVCAAVQHAVLAARNHLRTNTVGADPDAMIPHRQTLAAMLDGS
jgi:aminoglycoside phosphotransferase (APT) family kinase protein